MKELINVWMCDGCGKICEASQLVSDELDIDDMPEWIVLELPKGWVKDTAVKKEYCEDCWAEIYEEWLAEL